MNNAGAYREFYTLEGDTILGVKGGQVKEQQDGPSTTVLLSILLINISKISVDRRDPLKPALTLTFCTEIERLNSVFMFMLMLCLGNAMANFNISNSFSCCV